jgi:DedD protein
MDAYGNSWTVQVGAFSREQNALALYDKLKRLGYDVYMKEAIVNNTRFIRVRVGFYASMQDAQVMVGKLRQMSLPTQIVHLRYLTE